MNLTPVSNSAWIAALGYDSATQQLAVQFAAGPAVYLYSGVPPEVAERFAAAPSKGGFFGAWIKGKYPVQRSTPDQAQDAIGAP
jgi:hypothetical protein